MKISSESFCLPACSEYKARRQNMKLKAHLKPNRQSYLNNFNLKEKYDKIWLP